MAPILAFPVRLSIAFRYEASRLTAVARWLFTSHELTNFTYDLTELNEIHLAWFISDITSKPVAEIQGYFHELHDDDALQRHVEDGVRGSSRRYVSDAKPRYGRRLGWYALVRALKPEHVVETGTDKGLGTLVFQKALAMNGTGRVTTIDINPTAGLLLRGQYAERVDLRLGSSVEILSRLGSQVDLFIHDSLHTPEYEIAEFKAVAPWLSGRAIVLSDNAHASTALATWAAETERNFKFFSEKPSRHWYPGDGIGVASPSQRDR